MRTRWMLLPPVLIVLTAVAFAGQRAVLTRWRVHDLARLAPGLDREFTLHVVSDSDREWLDYCRRVGLGQLGDAVQTLSFQLRTAQYSQFLERRRPLEQASLRVAQGFTRAFDFPLPERGFRHYMALPPETDFHLRQLERRYIEVAADTSLSANERIRIVDGLVHEFAASRDSNRTVLAYLVTIRDELEAGRPEQHRVRLEKGLRMAQQYGQVYAECQLLGELGSIHGATGQEDSLRACLDEGIAIALNHGLLDQAARMLTFYASFYAEQGRLAQALNVLADAQRVCERPGGNSARLRLQIEYTKLAASLGCWDLVDRSLWSLPPLLREFPEIGRESELQKHVFDAGCMRAHLAFATGHPDEGARLMRELSQSVPAPNRRVGLAELYDTWSAGLAEAGRSADALAICDRGLAHCDSAHVPEHEMPLLIRRARLLNVLDRASEARRTLAQAESLRAVSPERDARVDREIGVLEAQLLLRQGKPDDAKRRIREVVRALGKTLAEGDGGPLSYLELDEAVSVRDAVHEIERFTPGAGYDFELQWRALPGRAGPDRLATRHHAIVGTHLVYRFTGNILVRWTATSSGVVVDTIPLPARNCLAMVREALGFLQSETPVSGYLGPRTLHCLRPLSSILLPRPLTAGIQRAGPVSISADGPLLALPFEALPVSTSRGEQPLVLTSDVTYVRGFAPRATAAGGLPVIVSNPELSPELQRRHGWDHGLTETIAESHAAQARWPNAVVLSGNRATREAVMRSWPGASIIYLAAHHVRDADAPFLGYVPLASPPGESGAAFLEVADVHAMDLSSCRLAVLASCASGAPYRMAVRPGVSLADAFIDAGAHAVVQSFWDVGDLETREFMTTFLAAWREDGNDAGALNQARRQIMATPGGAAPRVWAAWSLLERTGDPASGSISARAR